MKKLFQKILVLSTILSLLTGIFTNSIVQAKQKTKEQVKNTSYNYDNPIYNNGFEDTYLYDTTDSVITKKTNLSRNKPQIFGKFSRQEYPIPNISRVTDINKFNEILEENKEIMNNVEKDILNNTLKKHISADGQFYGTLSDDVKAVEKTIYINTNLIGTHSLAVFAPAGEIVSVKIPEEYIGKITIKVGITETNADNYNKNNGNENRMPRLGKDFKTTSTETKVGTPFGGMVYVNLSVEEGKTIPITVTGGVDSPYYDLGSTTLEQWKQAKNAPGLYAELRTPYIRFTLPSSEIRNLEDPYDILTFWTNAAALSTYAFGSTQRTLPTTLVFDPYVKAGAAVATVGAWICNMPTSWAKSSLNYEGYVKDGGWGTIHEFNHHWQGTYMPTGRWGLGDVIEVTNNVMNAATYILYTNIASYRTESALNGWNNVADPYHNLRVVLEEAKNNPNSPVKSVYMYTSLMHEFGVKNFLEVVKSNYSGGTYNGITLKSYNPEETRYDDFVYRTSVIFGKDLTYYFENVLHFEISTQLKQKIKELKFEQYIPVQNVYSAGVKSVQTGRPFYIGNSEFIFDFEKYTMTPGKFEISGVSNPKYGTITKNSNGTYTYKPNANIPENTIDEFDLAIKVTANGVTQTKVLVCKIGFNYNASKLQKYEINEDNTEKAIEKSKIIEPYSTIINTGINYKTDNGYNFSKGSGYFTVPKDGDYEFQAYGDDKIKFILTDNEKQYVSETNTYTGSVGAAYENKSSTHFNIKLKAGATYQYQLYTNNRGGIGAGYVSYRDVSAKNWISVENSNIYLNKEDIGKYTDKSLKLPEQPYYMRNANKVTNNIMVKYNESAKVLAAPRGQNGDGGGTDKIIDYDRLTFFHSAYSGSIKPFPHDYIIDAGRAETFNRIDICTRTNNTNGTPGDYEIYVANEYNGENTKWNKIASDETRKQNSSASTNITANVELTTARYVKVRLLNNKFGNNFTILSSVELSTNTKSNTKIAQNSSLILYQGNWTRNIDGNYINGATYNSTNGKMCYAFVGKETAIYSSKDAKIRVRVDNEGWKEYQLVGSKYSPSVILSGYKEEKHNVEVEVISGELGLNLLSTDGKFVEYVQIVEPTPEPEKLTITSQVYNIEDKYINKIKPETLIESFKKNINTNAKQIVIYDKNNKEVTDGKIATGMKLSLDNNKKVFTLIVTGDINEDGSISITDLVKLKKNIVGLEKLDEVQLKAADIDSNNNITITDLVKLKKALIGVIKL